MFRLEPRLFLTLLTLPVIQRQGLRSLFAFRHHVLEGCGKAGELNQVHGHFEECQRILERVYCRRRREFEYYFEPALEQNISRFEIPRKYLSHALEGALGEKLNGSRSGQSGDLLLRAYHAGGVWGAIASHVWSAEKSWLELGILVGNALWLARRRRWVGEEATAVGEIFPKLIGEITDQARNLQDTKARKLIDTLLGERSLAFRLPEV